MIFGIIGESGVGKTTAASFFKKKGFYVIFVDKIVKYIYTLKSVKQKIIKEFNDFIIDDKIIDKKKLRFEVFRNPFLLCKLENIIWPVMTKIVKKEIIKNKNKTIFLDCAVLFNSNLNLLVDKIILIKANQNKKINRIKLRDNLNDLEALSLLNYQKNNLILNKNINFLIENNDSIQDFFLKLQILNKNIINKFKNK